MSHRSKKKDCPDFTKRCDITFGPLSSQCGDCDKKTKCPDIGVFKVPTFCCTALAEVKDAVLFAVKDNDINEYPGDPIDPLRAGDLTIVRSQANPICCIEKVCDGFLVVKGTIRKCAVRTEDLKSSRPDQVLPTGVLCQSEPIEVPFRCIICDPRIKEGNTYEVCDCKITCPLTSCFSIHTDPVGVRIDSLTLGDKIKQLNDTNPKILTLIKEMLGKEEEKSSVLTESLALNEADIVSVTVRQVCPTPGPPTITNFPTDIAFFFDHKGEQFTFTGTNLYLGAVLINGICAEIIECNPCRVTIVIPTPLAGPPTTVEFVFSSGFRITRVLQSPP